MNRRKFLGNTLLGTLAIGAGDLKSLNAENPHSAMSKPSKIFTGVQCMPQSVFDEGVENMLDFMQQEGGIDTVCISTHVMHGGGGRPSPADQADHGVPKTPNTDKPLARIWIPYEDANFEGTSLRMPQGTPETEDLGGKDVLEAILEPAHRRGMKVYARHLEGFHYPLLQYFPVFEKVRQLNCLGERVEAPCWNHPEYRAFWYGYVRDVLKRYPVDGLYLGAERDAPFGPLFHAATPAVCFCEHCAERARKSNIDVARAREGMQKLTRLMQTKELPLDGMFINILRLWMKYPETMAWETLQAESKWSLFAELYHFGKAVRGEIPIGWHLPMYPLNHDIFSRAGWEYDKIAQNCDFIKPSLYFDVNAARLYDAIPKMQQHYLRDFTNKEVYEFFQTIFNMDKSAEPTYEESETNPFSPKYVYHEAKRAADKCKGLARVYGGIGVNVPNEDIDQKPEWVYHAAKAALEAGCDGLLLSREYHYMTKGSLNAAKKAVQEFTA